MSPKTHKLKRQYEREKLKDQAEILYTASRTKNIEQGKLDLVIKSVLVVKDIKCPERTKYLKEAISLSEELKLWKTAFKLATIGLSKKDEKEFFLDICQKYQEMENE